MLFRSADDSDDDEDYADDAAEELRPGRHLQNVSYERAGSERDESDQPEKGSRQDNSGTGSRRAPESKRQGRGQDGTIRQFPPHAGNR